MNTIDWYDLTGLATLLLTVTHWLLPSSFARRDRKSTRLNSSHSQISYAVFCLKTKTLQPAPIVTGHLSPRRSAEVATTDFSSRAPGLAAPRFACASGYSPPSPHCLSDPPNLRP